MRFFVMLLFFAPLFGQVYIPHITQGGNFKTTFTFTNSSGTVKGVVLGFYNDSGRLLRTRSLRLEEGEVQHFDASAMGAVSAQAAFTPGVSLSISYVAERPDATPAHALPVTKGSQYWRVSTAGDWRSAWDGVAVLNVGERSTTLQVMVDGVTKNLGSLSSNGKYLSLLQDFADADAEEVVFFADQPLAVTALRGSSDTRYMWSSDAVPTQGHEIHGDMSYAYAMVNLWAFAWVESSEIASDALVIADTMRLSSGEPAFTGRNGRGKDVSGAWSEDLQNYVILSEQGALDDVFQVVFYGDKLLGCHFQYNGSSLGSCHVLFGGGALPKNHKHVSLAFLEKLKR